MNNEQKLTPEESQHEISTTRRLGRAVLCGLAAYGSFKVGENILNLDLPSYFDIAVITPATMIPLHQDSKTPEKAPAPDVAKPPEV